MPYTLLILYNGLGNMAKIAPSHDEIQLPPNVWFGGPTGVYIPNCISTGSSICEGLMVVTN